MKNISLNIDKVAGFVSKETIAAYAPQVKACIETLENGTGKGNDFLGWLHLPSSITADHLTDLQETAQVLRENCEVVIVAGTVVVILVHAPLLKLYPTASNGCRKRKMLRLSFTQDIISVKITCLN